MIFLWWFEGPIFGHVGDGNFHCIIVFNETEANETKSAAQRMAE